jgi:hypothetical protein
LTSLLEPEQREIVDNYIRLAAIRKAPKSLVEQCIAHLCKDLKRYSASFEILPEDIRDKIRNYISQKRIVIPEGVQL